MIYQSLQDETAAMAARTVEIINLGLEPWEGVAMKLPVETVSRKSDRRQPVAKYIRDAEDGARWREWLQGNRIELNTMTTPVFLDWLDGKMAKHGNGRLVPPSEVLAERLVSETRADVERAVMDALLAKYQFPEKVAAAMVKLGPEIALKSAALEKLIRKTLAQPAREHLSWADVVCSTAMDITEQLG